MLRSNRKLLKKTFSDSAMIVPTSTLCGKSSFASVLVAKVSGGQTSSDISF